MLGCNHTPVGPAHCTSGVQSAPRSVAHLPDAARYSVSMVYHVEFVVESCLWRGYVPAGDTYTLGSLFTV